MDRDITADEAKAKQLELLGPKLGPVFYVLQNDLLWLHLKWAQQTELFATRPQRVDLLNATAPLFFRIVQDVLWEDTLVHLSRMTDPAKSPGKGDRRNATINALPELLSDTVLRAVVDPLAQRATELAAFARDWRNRHLAHRDLRLALSEETAHPLAPATRAAVDEVLGVLGKTLNAISTHFQMATLQYDAPIHFGGAVSVLQRLQDAEVAWEERRRRSEAGEWTLEDVRRPPPV